MGDIVRSYFANSSETEMESSAFSSVVHISLLPLLPLLCCGVLWVGVGLCGGICWFYCSVDHNSIRKSIHSVVWLVNGLGSSVCVLTVVYRIMSPHHSSSSSGSS